MAVRTDSRLNWYIGNGGHIVKETQQAVQAAEQKPVRLIDTGAKVKYVVLPVGLEENNGKNRLFRRT